MRVLSFFTSALVFLSLVVTALPFAPYEAPSSPLQLEREPLVRIGLLTNTSSVVISTVGEPLAASLSGVPPAELNIKSVRVSSTPYRPPSYDLYTFEMEAYQSRAEADKKADEIRGKTSEPVSVSYGSDEGTFRIKIGSGKETQIEADEYLADLTARGIEGVSIVTSRLQAPSDDAVALTAQIRSTPKSEVRSLRFPGGEERLASRGRIIRTASAPSSWRKNVNVPINSSLREVSVTGATPESRFSSLRAITIGSGNGRGIVRLNGKSYRGAMEILANSKGGITVVNVVPMEDYLLGVVPAELSLPQIEAQKAQAVAARTYAVANKNGYGEKGYDMLPTVWSQVYKGVSIESKMGTRAVLETRGMVATYEGTPINALYTSTCGGRTEDSGNIFEFNEPYLKGVDCSLDGREHFDPFIVRTSREPALIRNEANYAMVRLASRYAVNNFLMITPQFNDDYFDDPPSETELRSWLNNLGVKTGRTYAVIDADSSKPLNLARILHAIIYAPDAAASADTLMSESDINYHLSFLDAAEVPKYERAILAELLRDGWFSIYADLTIKPNKHYSRGKILRLIDNIYAKKGWSFDFESGTANPTADGKLILKAGRSEKEIVLNPHVYLFRKFGDSLYQVRETAILGGETVRYKTNSAGEAVYLAVEPTDKTTVAESMSPFTFWKANLSAGTVRARLSRYVRGLGTLIDVKIKNKGFSRRATELEIITTNGVHYLKGGKIRSALKLREQLFVMDKRFDGNGRVASISFTGRGWGHGVGMCQYGAYGLAKMGVPYDRIIKHYYSGVELTKAY
ncbi:MAG TPA: SpoIID/LytB domain-containing protein [Aridibacter sp.]|nr:SpoIID/LytB domain-containing protein [Aridibacter sp.]